MAKLSAVKKVMKPAPTKLIVEKAADFRSIHADSCVPVGSPLEITIILTRSEPGPMVQTIGAVVSEKIQGVQQVNVTNSSVDAIYVQAGHVTLDHAAAAELAGNLIKLVEALDSELYEATLKRFELQSAVRSNDK